MQQELSVVESVGSHSFDLPSTLPDGCEIQHVEFVSDACASPVLMEFREPRICRAVLRSGPGQRTPPGSERSLELTLLLVPSGELETADLSASVWDWVEPDVSLDRRQGLMITLHAVRIVWTPGRVGIIAPQERLETLRLALVEFTFHDGEVRAIETALAAAWPELEADSPLAFQFDDRAALRREQLAQRFQQIITLRSRLARINPVLHRPPVHPPTLAGQLSERLKERTRLMERIEFLSGQVEVLERVYEMCAQRANEFAYSRKETTLEWVIIALLATETVVLLIDLLARLGN